MNDEANTYINNPAFNKLVEALFPVPEGEIDYYYGHIGQGKTTGAVADIIDDLKHGQIVHANFNINWDGFNQSDSFFYLFLGFIGIKKNFFEFEAQNFKFFDTRKMSLQEIYNYIREVQGGVIYLDEGHNYFDSYLATKLDPQIKHDILTTRHNDRIIKIISQRPTAVHVTARANVNRFFKFERILKFPFLIFRRTEYQDMKEETVDEEAEPVSTKWYIPSNEILNSFDSKHMRLDLGFVELLDFKVHRYSYSSILKKFFSTIIIGIIYRVTFLVRVVKERVHALRLTAKLLNEYLHTHPDMLIDHRSYSHTGIIETRKSNTGTYIFLFWAFLALIVMLYKLAIIVMK